MSALRIILLATACLTLGFAAGWRLQHRPAAAHVGTPDTSPEIAPVPAISQSKSVDSVVQPAVKAAGSQVATPSVNERLAVLRWLKGNGLFVGVQLFSHDGVSPQFAVLYGLTPAETAQLNNVYQETKQRLEALAGQRARLDETSTAEKLIVTVPSFPVEGGQAYNELLATFASVLGTDRYALFNAISGDSLENEFDGFGLSNNRYEVTLLKPDQGRQLVSIRRSFSIPVSADGGVTGGTSFNTMDARDVGKTFPLLKAFGLPSNLNPPTK